VSRLVPTNGELAIACIPSGSPGHSWATASSSGASIGFKGMQYAAKVLAASGIDFLLTPSSVEKAKAEFAEKTKGFVYKSAIPDGQKPPVPDGE
jgi:aminobenzoyl-glutamate utilization protein B